MNRVGGGGVCDGEEMGRRAGRWRTRGATMIPAATGAGAVLVAVAALAVLIGLSPVLAMALIIGVLGVAAATLAWRRSRRDAEAVTGTGVVLGHAALATVVVAAAIQAVPYGREHSNPPVTGEPAWATPRTRALMVAACYDCHSNEVEWPWYASIAPLSWAVTDHVDEGRDAVNYSEFTTGGDDEADDTIEVILDGEMPPYYYTLFGLHPEANLSPGEVDELVAGLRATPGLAGEREDDYDEDDEDDESGDGRYDD